MDQTKSRSEGLWHRAVVAGALSLSLLVCAPALRHVRISRTNLLAGQSTEITVYPPAGACVLVLVINWGDGEVWPYQTTACLDRPMSREHRYVSRGRHEVRVRQYLADGTCLSESTWVGVT